jgi:hypothetical protein
MAFPDRISPRWILIAGWIVFVLCTYPGAMSVDSALQLFDVRNGVYTDTYPPVMTAVWSLLEIVFAGPAPMLVLQSGLFLFGLAALLARILSPRAAAGVAVGVLLFPPVLTTMGVIWPDPLVAGCLLAGTSMVLGNRLSVRLGGLALFALAIACRPEETLAVVPLAWLAVTRELPTLSRLLRFAATCGIVLVLSLVSRGAEWALTDKPTYTWQQALLVPDVTSIVRRTHPKTAADAQKLLGDVKLANVDGAADRMMHGGEARDWWGLTHGDKRAFEPIANDDERAALSATWRKLVTHYPLAYFKHRLEMTKTLLGVHGRGEPVFDDLGDPDLLAPLHHRATPSAWQHVSRRIIRGVTRTPVSLPILYLLLAIALVVLARGIPVLRALAVSGLVYEVTWMFLAPGADYRYSHWLIATATIGAITLLARRRYASPAR